MFSTQSHQKTDTAIQSHNVSTVNESKLSDNGWQYSVHQTNAVMVAIEAGKKSSAGLVDQPKQKGDTCGYYVMNYLRDRVGKVVPSGMEEKRGIEKILSSHRKQKTQAMIRMFCENELATSVKLSQQYNPIAEVTIEYLQDLFNKAYSLVTTDPNFKIYFQAKYRIDFQDIHKKYMQEFAAVIQSTYEYYLLLNYSKEELLNVDVLTELRRIRFDIQHYKNSFNELKLNVPELYRELFEKQESARDMQNYPTSIQQLPDQLKLTIVHNLYYLASAKLNGLSMADWHPKNGLDGLMDCIKLHGPLMASGYIGQEYYPKTAAIKIKIGQIQATAFKPNSMVVSDQRGHVVLIMGAIKAGYKNAVSDLVFYLDPNTPQLAHTPLTIFTVSYNNFVKHLSKTHGPTLQGDAKDKWNLAPEAKFLFFKDRANKPSSALAELTVPMAGLQQMSLGK